MYRKSCCTAPGVGVDGMDKLLKFYIKVVGKALSGELWTWTGLVLSLE